jgi:hypothetical protein
VLSSDSLRGRREQQRVLLAAVQHDVADVDAEVFAVAQQVGEERDALLFDLRAAARLRRGDEVVESRR